MQKLKVIISGGGTGGHIFPALSIAGSLKELNPDNEILFVGANGRMEMERVPKAGYPIIGLNIQTDTGRWISVIGNITFLIGLALQGVVWALMARSKKSPAEAEPKDGKTR